MEIEEKKDKEDILEREEEIRRKWDGKGRRRPDHGGKEIRWRIVEAAKRKRANRKRVVAKNRELWVEEIRWRWDEGQNWEREEEE